MILRTVCLFFLLASVATACTPGSDDASATLVIPTPIIQSDDEAAGPSRTSNQALPAAPTFEVPTESTDAETVTEQLATPTPEEGPQLHQVVFVAVEDVLNVRSGPGVDFEVVDSLPPDAAGILVTGLGQVASSSTWVPISADGQTGWVNSRFLSETVDSEVFCQDESVLTLLDDFKRAVAEENDELLARLIHPERGLRISHSWWNPQVLIREDEAEQLFSSSTEYDWGTEDGSGHPIDGSFAETIVPLLQEDFLAATEEACNEIVHGGTAGLIQLPDGYESVNYFSFHRPGTEQFGGMDWGSWVVGVEQWQDAYYLSYLVHFAWEI